MAEKTDPIPTRYFYALAAVVFAVSVLKGLRMPNRWAATHMTFNYAEGFIRRGLFGEVLLLVSGGRLYRYRALFIIAVLLFVAVTVMVTRMSRRALRLDEGDLGLKAALLAFAASPGLVFWAHMIGYLDYVGVLSVSIFILWSASSRRPHAMFVVAAGIGVVLALIHESMVVMFMPTMLFAMICHIIVRTRGGQPPRNARALAIAQASMATAVPSAAAILICVFGTRSPPVVEALQTSIARLADFSLRRDAFETLYQPVTQNLFQVMPAMFRFHPHHTMQVVHGLVVSSFGLVAMSAYGLRLIHRLGLTERERPIVVAGFVAATLAPLSLNFLGWDSARWNAICFFNAFFAIMTLKLFFTARAPEPVAHRINEPFWLTVSAVAVVFGLTTSYDLFLFDGYLVQWFPFDQRLKAFIWMIKDGFQTIPGA
jgi:hypothetical protein